MNRRDFLKLSAVAAVAKTGTLIAAEAVTTNNTAPASTNSAADKPRKIWVPTDPANSPMGMAKGIFPGRVVWTRDPAATPWHGDITNGHWWETGTGVNQAAVDRMMSRSLQALTGTTSDARPRRKIRASPAGTKCTLRRQRQNSVG